MSSTSQPAADAKKVLLRRLLRGAGLSVEVIDVEADVAIRRVDAGRDNRRAVCATGDRGDEEENADGNTRHVARRWRSEEHEIWSFEEAGVTHVRVELRAPTSGTRFRSSNSGTVYRPSFVKTRCVRMERPSASSGLM